MVDFQYMIGFLICVLLSCIVSIFILFLYFSCFHKHINIIPQDLNMYTFEGLENSLQNLSVANTSINSFPSLQHPRLVELNCSNNVLSFLPTTTMANLTGLRYVFNNLRPCVYLFAQLYVSLISTPGHNKLFCLLVSRIHNLIKASYL